MEKKLQAENEFIKAVDTLDDLIISQINIKAKNVYSKDKLYSEFEKEFSNILKLNKGKFLSELSNRNFSTDIIKRSDKFVDEMIHSVSTIPYYKLIP